MSSSSAKQYADQQRAASFNHHQKRVDWLSSANPVWSCGSPVLPSEKAALLHQSQNYLQGNDIGINHCDCEPRCA